VRYLLLSLDHIHGACRSHDRIAVVDVGSTSFKLLVATLDPATNSLVSLYEEKRQVKLLSGTEFSTISESAMDRALNAIGHFTAVATKYGVPLQAIATAGLRDAADSASLVQAVQEKVRCAWMFS
jgi:exopolyphosphatase/pppGpp-phosphohydrolase